MRKNIFRLLAGLRLVLGILVLLALTATFLDFTGTVAGWFPSSPAGSRGCGRSSSCRPCSPVLP